MLKIFKKQKTYAELNGLKTVKAVNDRINKGQVIKIVTVEGGVAGYINVDDLIEFTFLLLSKKRKNLNHKNN